MSPEMLHKAWAAVVLIGVAAFLDTPFLTWGQRYKETRGHARLALVSLEINLFALWAMAKFIFHWEWRIVPAALVPALGALGLAVTLAGVVLAVWAKVRLGRWFSGTLGVKEGHVLITDGPYSITRHPIYTGVIIALTGSGLTWNSTITVALGLLISVPLFFQSVYEESLFERHFGEPYFGYEKRVPRLVPFVRGRGGAPKTPRGPVR